MPRDIPTFAFMQDQLWPQVTWAIARLTVGGLLSPLLPQQIGWHISKQIPCGISGTHRTCPYRWWVLQSQTLD